MRRLLSIDAERAQITANEYILFHYAIGLGGGTACLVTLADNDLWVVPVLLTSPGYGIVGEVGMVAVDAQPGKVAGSTPRSDVAISQKRLREEHREAIEAAFLRARQA